jgi:outer membrane protein insertion porin family
MTTPLFASPLLSFALSAFSLDRDNTAFASHRERSQGGRAKISVSQLKTAYICQSWAHGYRLYVPGETTISHTSMSSGISTILHPMPRSRESPTTSVSTYICTHVNLGYESWRDHQRNHLSYTLSHLIPVMTHRWARAVVF